MSRWSATVPLAARTLLVVGVVVALVLGSVVLGQRLVRGSQAGAAEAPMGAVDLTFSTFLGGLEWDEAYDVEVDDSGNRYVTGFTMSDDLPKARAEGPGGIVDGFVAKITRGGTLAWNVILGGTRLDTATSLALDSHGNVYVTGRTESPDFPTANALQARLNGSSCTGAPCHDAFVTKLTAEGEVVYSTYLGGSLNEEGLGIAVDDRGSAYVSGNTDSLDLPVRSAFQTEFGSLPCEGDVPCSPDTFVSKLSPNGGELVYSTYLGGNAGDTNAGIAVADDRTAYITGTTRSTDFPAAGGVQGSVKGTACGPPPGEPCPDVFVTALSADGKDVKYSTLLGGTEPETAGGVAVDATGRAVITGGTQSPDFPTRRPVQPALDNASCTSDQPEELCDDAFVTRLSPDGAALDFSTYLGGLGQDQGLGVAVDDAGNVAVAGSTDSSDFPTRRPVQAELGGYIDGFVSVLAARTGALAWSTFVGGKEAERANAVAVGSGTVSAVGRTLSPDFPTVGPVQPELRDDDYDAFLSTIGG